jgi:N-acetylglutamate synthase-like GNAT family acetyltransferase
MLKNISIEFLAENEALLHPLAEIHQKVFGHFRPDKTLTYFVDRYRAYLNTQKIPMTLIAKSGEGELLGAASLVEYDMTINREYSPWLSGVLVKEEYRKQGVGRQLVQAIELEATKLSFEDIYLFTFDRAHFYQYLGYETLKSEIYLGIDVTVMEKHL